MKDRVVREERAGKGTEGLGLEVVHQHELQLTQEVFYGEVALFELACEPLEAVEAELDRTSIADKDFVDKVLELFVRGQ